MTATRDGGESAMLFHNGLGKVSFVEVRYQRVRHRLS